MRYVKQFVTEKSPRASILRWIIISVTIAATILSLTLPAFAQTKYVITDGDNIIVCMSSSSDPMVVIEEAGLKLGAEDTYTTQTNGEISEIYINRIQMITVQDGGDTVVVGSYGGTVRELLSSLDITLTSSAQLSCDPDELTYDGMTITLTYSEIEVVSYDEVIPHKTNVYEDTSLTPGEEVVLSEGSDGLMHCTAQIRYENGVEVERTVLSEKTVTKAVDTVILRGVDRSVKEQENSGQDDYQQSHTSEIGTGDTKHVPGTNLEYSEILDFQATAYYCEPYAWNTTYTGTEARVGAIAVDPNFIPLGTKMYIVSADGKYIYGYCTAEDTGGAIKGKIVDLYFNTYEECIQFGRRDVKIYILK
ncbi:MAG: G5 domain-containing protein [Oscillospiraceae bacterium]|nr:G5 domain-containing protein [Oscillospiraceae bacterium]